MARANLLLAKIVSHDSSVTDYRLSSLFLFISLFNQNFSKDNLNRLKNKEIEMFQLKRSNLNFLLSTADNSRLFLKIILQLVFVFFKFFQ